MNCLHEVTKLLNEEKRYEEITALCEAAISTEPYEETLHEYLLKSLISSGKKSRALEHYNFISKKFYKDLGVKLSDSIRCLYKELINDLKSSETDISTITGSTNPYSFEIDKDYDVTATFDEDEPGNEPEDESIYLDGLMIYGEAVNGYIEDQDDGAILDTAEGKFYDAGSIARLRAVANDGYTFAGWEFERVDEYLDVDTTDNTAEIGIRESLPGNLEVEPAWLGDGILVIAKFDPKPSEPTTPPAPTPVTTTTYYNLDVEVEGPGKVLPTSGLFTENSSVEFSINAEVGARFVGWFGENGSEVAGNSIVMNGNKKLIAKFEAIPEEEPEEELPEEIVPAASPEEDVVEEQDVPYDAPILPQTGGIPLGLMISAGTGLMTAGFSLRKKKKDDAE